MSMNVSSISSVGSSQKTPPSIIAKLQELGVAATGDYQTDVSLLASASTKQGNKAGKSEKSGQSQKSSSPPKEALPWADLLSKLGLQPQGSMEADFAAMTTKISSLEASAKTDSEKANIAGLKSELQTAQAAAGSMQAPPQGGQNAFAGLNALAQMNQAFHGLSSK